MRLVLRIAAMLLIFLTATVGWMILGGTTSARSTESSMDMRNKVSGLWGDALHIKPPSLTFAHAEPQKRTETWTDDKGRERERDVTVMVTERQAQLPASTTVLMDIDDDIRRKGLVWFPLYDLSFDGQWTYHHTSPEAGTLEISWPFPTYDGFYDDFAVLVDGVEVDAHVQSNAINLAVPVVHDQVLQLQIRFNSRGNEQLTYSPGDGVVEIEQFSLVMNTDFHDIDFPAGTLSPSDRQEEGDGWRIEWTFDRMLAGKGMGVVVPSPVQPGELVSSMAFSAPISLGLFMTWIFVLGLLKGIDVHPVNHAFLAAAFFAFHLLFAYSADILAVELAFALSAVVSMTLVLTYLVRVVSPRFAVVEAGIAQLIYLVGFALAHFWDGVTGLTLTVIGIGTLFALMQLTSHVRWSEVFASGRMKPVEA